MVKGPRDDTFAKVNSFLSKNKYVVLVSVQSLFACLLFWRGGGRLGFISQLWLVLNSSSFLPQLPTCKECCTWGCSSEEGVGSNGAEIIGLCEPPDVGYVEGGILTPSLLKDQ